MDDEKPKNPRTIRAIGRSVGRQAETMPTAISIAVHATTLVSVHVESAAVYPKRTVKR